MTAEVAVLNRGGVALASDSAVTIGRSAQKIWTSADKLFQLSETDPIGVMIYGNANFVGLPWETVIKEYRHQYGGKSFPEVKEHAENLLHFLATSPKMFPKERQKEHALILCTTLLLTIREEMGEKIDRRAENEDGLNEDELSPILDEILISWLNQVCDRSLIKGVTSQWKNRLQRTLWKDLAKIRSEIFGNLPLSKRAEKILAKLPTEMLTREYFGPLKGGLVVAGFGSLEYMPSLVSYELEEMVSNQVRYRQTEEVTIGEEVDAAVLPFAQQDSVYAFMQGIDKTLLQFMHASTKELFTGAIDLIVKALKEAESPLADKLDRLKPNIKTLSENLLKKWQEAQRDYWEPIVTNISSLPKDELAAMAEAFVNLTKFRRRVTTERETVGGPIDVAVITKGDGFVWIARKHYFDPAKNPRMIARYTGGNNE